MVDPINHCPEVSSSPIEQFHCRVHFKITIGSIYWKIITFNQISPLNQNSASGTEDDSLHVLENNTFVLFFFSFSLPDERNNNVALTHSSSPQMRLCGQQSFVFFSDLCVFLPPQHFS